MVLIAPFVGAAVFLSGLARALPTSYGSSDSSSNYGSSDSSSNYGSSDSSSSYGSSGSSSSNYGSSDSSSSNYGSGDSSSNYGSSNYGSGNYGSSNSYDTSSVDNNQYTSTTSAYNNQYTSTTAYNNQYTSSTEVVDSTSTSTTSAYNSYSTSSYGSGSSYWGGSGYEDCVNQCVAQFGGSTGGGSYQATATSGSSGSYGTGATHTVIVAPTAGVFRMVPFATNASVGDTIEFHWGASNHTVTKSSALTPCNKSLEAPVFASGEQNISFVFSQVVNDTQPTFYYCGTPTHCEKGMFGIINPASTDPGSPTSLGGMMSSMAANDSDLAAYSAYSSNLTASNDVASTWGENFDMSAIPEWAASLFATNVLYTRATIGKNPEIIGSDNAIDLASVASVPLDLPMDLTPALNAAAAAPATSASVTPAGDAATAAASPSASVSAPATKSNGAISVSSPRMLVGAVVVLATFFAL